MADVAAAKRALRKSAGAVLRELDGALVLAGSAQASDRLVGLGAFARARSVSVFLSMPGELDTRGLVHACFDHGKHVFVPRVAGPGRADMSMVLVSTPEQLRSEACFALSKWGIPEPTEAFAARQVEAARELPPVDFVVVPGLAFDSRMGRLGRGKGYYDTYIAALQEARAASQLPPAVLAVRALVPTPVPTPASRPGAPGHCVRRAGGGQRALRAPRPARGLRGHADARPRAAVRPVSAAARPRHRRIACARGRSNCAA